jgi:hypothetical protein
LQPVGGFSIYVYDHDGKMSIFIYRLFLGPPQLSFFSSPRSSVSAHGVVAYIGLPQVFILPQAPLIDHGHANQSRALDCYG